MKLTLEDRLKIIELYEQGYSKSQLSKKSLIIEIFDNTKTILDCIFS